MKTLKGRGKQREPKRRACLSWPGKQSIPLWNLPSLGGAITMNLTINQELHRAYLQSPIWQAKRLEALAHYGTNCSRCGEYGTDVHHRTYVRSGGGELMRDLEVLCRVCHEAHHRSERAGNNRRSRRKGISRVGLFRYLTQPQLQVLKEKFNILLGQIYSAIVIDDQKDIIKEALRLLGKHYVFNTRPSSSRRNYRRTVHL